MDLEQLEAIALAEDRTRALEQLIPGTEDYFHFHCLHHQHRRELDACEAVLGQWIARFGRTARARVAEHRLALLRWDEAPEATAAHLREALGLIFDHERQHLPPAHGGADDAGRAPGFPSAIDPERISRDALKRRALGQHRDLGGFTAHALPWLAAEPLAPDKRYHLLQRLERPDVPGLADLVLADLDHRRAAFGSLAIHDALLVPQLEELAQKRPALLAERAFVDAWLRKLAPGADTDWEHDADAREAYLDRLWAFAAPLSPAFHSLKVHILYHRLALDQRRGIYDRERFLAYLKLPRQVHYVPDAHLDRWTRSGGVAHLGSNFHPQTGLDVVYDDEPLVRDFLAHFAAAGDDCAEFEPYVRDDYLRALIAATKLMAGDPDRDRWHAMLDDPAEYQALVERVDLELAPQNPTRFRADAPVVLDVYVKNAPSVVLKVFEINTLSYALIHGRDVDTSVDLDGLVATVEQTQDYDVPPLRRVRRRFTLESLTEPGVYIAELLGGGKSSRALIRKGALRHVERLAAAGHVITVLDEDGRPLPDAAIWLGGREFTARDDGTVLIPYGSRTQPEHAHILLRHGRLTARVPFVHRGEAYRFTAGIHIDGEQLIAGATAEVAIRPALYLNDAPASVSLLEQVSLTIESRDRHGVTAGEQITGLALRDDEETLYRFQVPPDLVQLSFTVRAVVKPTAGGKDVRLSDSTAIAVNHIDTTSATCDIHLSATRAGYVLYLLGKNGEPRAGEPLSLTLSHRDFTRDVVINVQTDDRACVALGALPGITRVRATHGSGADGSFALPAPRCRYPRIVHACAGDEIAIPYVGAEDTGDPEPVGAGGNAPPSGVSLLSVVSPTPASADGRHRARVPVTFAHDWRGAVRISGGFLRIAGIPAGDYDLWLADSATRIELRVADAGALGGVGATVTADGAAWAASRTRLLELGWQRPLHIADVAVEDDAVIVQLANATVDTRLHVAATRFLPARSAFDALAGCYPREPRHIELPRPRSHYLSGRDIGDEHRYILERRRAAQFAGNTLERPGVLLNPWDVRGTDTETERLSGGEAYAARGGARSGGPPIAKPAPAAPIAPAGRPTNLDFLANPSVVLHNLRPDPSGVVRIKRSRLGGASQLRLLALDGTGAVSRDVPLPEPGARAAGDPAGAPGEATTPTESPIARRDLRLMDALPPDRNFIEKNQITALAGGDELTIDDVATAEVERFDTLADVYQLMATISGDATLAEFRFILDWPDLDPLDRRAHYSQYACHELNLYLARKDPEFFASVVAPHLRNKRTPTFLDHYLLDDDLSDYLEPWAHARLNTLERILLADRVASDRDACARHIRERHELHPSDSERDDHLFRVALHRRALHSRGGPGGGGPPAPPAQPAPEPTPGGPARRPAAAPKSALAAFAPPATEAQRAMERAELPRAAIADARELDDSSLDSETTSEHDALPTAGLGGADSLRRDAIDRDGHPGRAFYRPVDNTREWAENNYYRRPLGEQDPGLIPVNAFWVAFAARDRDAPFVSGHIAHAAGSFTEMMCALAVLDLPFTAASHAITRGDSNGDGARMTLRAASPAIVFHQEIKPVGPASGEPGGPGPILVSQNYFRQDDRYTWERGERRDKFVRGELLVHTPYLCQVVLTNPTSSVQTLDLLLQIPRGALPVDGGFTTRGQHVRVDAYATRTIEYAFYFPEPGRFSHFPAHVSQSGALVASAEPGELTVVAKLTRIDAESWAHVSQHGTNDDVLALLATANTARLDLSVIAWRMRDRAFYDAVIALLTERHGYDHTLWSYSLLHLDGPRIATFLRHEPGFLRQLGMGFGSPLVSVDGERRGWYEHFEYAPLINARAHRVAGRPAILNQAFAAQYRRFLEHASSCAVLSDSDRLAATYYLLLQDRVAEGQQMFDRVDRERIRERLQYDYLRTFLSFYGDDPGAARELATRYQHYPVEHWRRRFSLALALLDEAEGDTTMVIDADDITERQSRLIRRQAGFELAVEPGPPGKPGVVTISYQSLTACEVNYYEMDIELLFSRQPFVQEQTDRFSIVRPNRSERVELPADQLEHAFAIPAEYASSNIIVEVVAGGERRAQAHYAHELRIQLIHQYGQIRVHHRGSSLPLPRTYIKTYARLHDGQVLFYKDGYTDLCGVFEYAALSTDMLDRVDRFALLVMHDELGAVVREAPPPKR